MTASGPVWAERIRAEREARGWGKWEMGRRLLGTVGIEPTTGRLKSLGRQMLDWEKGRHFPRDWASAYASTFGLSEWELFGDPSPPAIERRSVLELGVAAGAVTIAPGIGHYGPVAPELVGYFRQQLPGDYRADMWLGPHMLIPTVEAQTKLLQQLVRAADTPVRRGLLEMGVAYAALLGWLYQDAADLLQSAYWRDVALDMAHRTGDVQLIGYALANKAMHAIDTGDGAAIVDYAWAALTEEGRLSPKVRVLVLVHLGHGYGFLCDREGADRAFDRAEAVLDQVDDEHPWGNACRRTPEYMDIQRATAYGRAGDHDDATRIWERILGGQPDDYRRDTGVFWARQAAAIAAASEPEREKVVRIAGLAATTCGETGSARLRAELVALPGHATAWSHTPHWRELTDIIATVT